MPDDLQAGASGNQNSRQRERAEGRKTCFAGRGWVWWILHWPVILPYRVVTGACLQHVLRSLVVQVAVTRACRDMPPWHCEGLVASLNGGTETVDKNSYCPGTEQNLRSVNTVL